MKPQKPVLRKEQKYAPYTPCGALSPTTASDYYHYQRSQGKGRTLYLVDAGPLAFFTMARCESVKDPAIVRAFVDFALSGGFLRNTPDFDHNGTVVLLKDHKPYWKSLFYEDYKGKRGDKPAQFSPTMDLLSEFEGLTLSQPHYEADDFAGAIVRAFRLGQLPTYSRIVLWTLDTDWLMLTGKDVFWYDMRSVKAKFSREVRQSPDYTQAQTFFNGRERDGAGLISNYFSLPPDVRKYVQIPSFRDGELAVLWACKWQERNNKPVNVLAYPYEITDLKCEHGDRSDNLVATPVPRFLVDLYQPPADWDLLTNALTSAIMSLRPNLDSQLAKRCWTTLVANDVWLG